MEAKILYFTCEEVTEVALIKKLLEKNGYYSLKNDKEKKKDLIENIFENKNYSYSSYILPNDMEDGMTETLLNKCFLSNKTVKYIEETTFKEIEELKEIIINNKDKSLFMIMAALLAKKGVAHHFIENNFKNFDSNNEDLKKLENWISEKIS